MKILMITPSPPKLDGIGAHTAALVQALRDTGDVDVEVLAQRRPAPEAGSADPWIHHVLAGVGAARINAVMRRVRPDVVHVQFAIPALGPSAIPAFRAAARARAEWGAHVVVTCHEVRRELDLLRGAGRAVYRRIVDVADLVVVHTGEARDLLIDVCGAEPQQVACMPLGAPSRASGPATDVGASRAFERRLSGRPFALSFGFLHPDKGIEHAIEAMAMLRDRAPLGFDLVIAGAVRPRTGVFRWFERADHAYERGLRAAVDRHRLGEHVRFVGFVPDDQVGALFTAARAVVMPCRAITQSSVAGLAIAHGTPVVATDLPGLHEAFGAGAVYVPVGDSERLADSLAGIMEDDELTSSLRIALRQRAEAVALPVVAAELVEQYRRTTASPALEVGAHG